MCIYTYIHMCIYRSLSLYIYIYICIHIYIYITYQFECMIRISPTLVTESRKRMPLFITLPIYVYYTATQHTSLFRLGGKGGWQYISLALAGEYCDGPRLPNDKHNNNNNNNNNNMTIIITINIYIYMCTERECMSK